MAGSRLVQAVSKFARNSALMRAAQECHVDMVRLLLTRGASADVRNENGKTALMKAAAFGHCEIVKALVENGASVDLHGPDNVTALMCAASTGELEIAQLLSAAGADPAARDEDGETAADMALRNNHPLVFAFLDPATAKLKGAELLEAMHAAKLVHVLSTRFKRHESQEAVFGSCNPFSASREAKAALEQAEHVFAFNPNADNAFLVDGDKKSANAIWLLNWQRALERARVTGGRMVQIIVEPGLSKMQEAEVQMAMDKGVPVIRLDCSDLRLEHCGSSVNAGHLKALPGWADLTTLAEHVAGGGALDVPPTRAELLREKEGLLDEVRAATSIEGLREKLGLDGEH